MIVTVLLIRKNLKKASIEPLAILLSTGKRLSLHSGISTSVPRDIKRLLSPIVATGTGGRNRTSKEHAIHSALASCRARNLEFEKTQPCRVINLNDKWSDIYRQSIVSEQSGESAIMSNKALNAYRQKYLDVTRDKAFAQSDNGAWSWRSSKTSESDAVKKALAACRKNNKNHDEVFPCRIINVNNSWRGS